MFGLFSEWLDAGNNKKAVQEADKVLKKQGSLPCAQVLKGLALLRLGKREECEDLVSAVVKQAPTDEATLQALTICFRELHQRESNHIIVHSFVSHAHPKI